MEGILRLYGHSGFRLAEIREYLAKLENAYNAIYTFDAYISAFERESQYVPHPSPVIGLHLGFPLVGRGRIRFLVSWPPTPETIAPVVLPRNRLVLRTVQLESPGFWEFLGKLNPLEVIRQYLNDRHERKKDIEYRKSAEKRKLNLENQLLENKVISERIQMAKDLGATLQDLAPLLTELIYRPLQQLDKLQDDEVIQTAELLE